MIRLSLSQIICAQTEYLIGKENRKHDGRSAKQNYCKQQKKGAITSSFYRNMSPHSVLAFGKWGWLSRPRSQHTLRTLPGIALHLFLVVAVWPLNPLILERHEGSDHSLRVFVDSAICKSTQDLLQRIRFLLPRIVPEQQQSVMLG